MQTSTYSLSGTRHFRQYAKYVAACFASALVIILLAPDHKTASIKISSVVSNKSDYTSIVNKMYNATYRGDKRKVAHTENATADTNQLKQSDWFKAVQQDISKRMYNVISEKDSKIFASINNAQLLRASYSADKFSLQPLQANYKKQEAKNNWQLNMSVNGIYADDKLLQQPSDEAASIRSDNNDMEYNFGNSYTIQYHNDSKGVRQNFVVKEKPSQNVSELKVSLKVEGDWVINKVHDKELHFAKINARKILENKITYNDLKAWDANGKLLAARMEVKENNNFEIITEVSNASFPVTIDPLSTSPSSTLTGTGTFGNSVASAGDVNGDGYSDVIVGAYSLHSAFIFLGSASGLSNSPATTLTGTGNFGITVASAGDINGDGYSDVIVGDAGGDAYVYQGSSTGVSTSPATSLTSLGLFGANSVATAGDVDGDGISDVIIGSAFARKVFVYLGTLSGLSTTATTLNGPGLGFFGASVASAGDINADGFSDIIIGDGGGNAYIYLGSIAPLFTLSAIHLTGTNPHFGMSVSSAGDVNGDGYSDVIIGDGGGNAFVFNGSASAISSGTTSSASTTLSSATDVNFGVSVSGTGDVNGDAYADVIVGDSSGNAFIYLGSASGLSTSATDTLNAAGNFGISVASAGDVNGDGYSDIIVGDYSLSQAFNYNGSPTGAVSTNTISILGTSDGGSQLDRLGFSVSSAGDVNGDGYSDVIVGVLGYNQLTGAAYVYLGSSTGLQTGSPSILTTPTDPSVPDYSWSTAGIGDINGDGYDDVAVGAPSADGDHGSVYIYLGSSSGISSASLSAKLDGVNNFDNFGISVASAGDVNGDGYADMIVGAFQGGANQQGAAYIYMGSPTGISSSATADTLYGSGAFSSFGRSVATAGDVNGDGYSDVIVGEYGTTSAYVYLGSKTGIANNATANYVLTDNTFTLGNFGVSVSSAGDVNGDGFSDVIVGASNVSGFVPGSGGAAAVYLGSAGGLSNTPATVLNGLTPGDQFGASVSSAGDVNGDGYSDVIVRATLAQSNIGIHTGAAYIFLGGTTGLSSTIATSFLDEGSTDANLEGTNFRRAVASAGDVNGDGYSDVLVGVYIDNTNGFKAGATHLYYGNNAVGHNASNVLRLYETDLTNPIKADNITQSNFGLGLLAQSPFGHVKGRLVWETETNGTPFQSIPPSPITNNVVTTGNQIPYSAISVGGLEFKNLIPKSPGKATKVRVRIQYAPSAVTFGQVYSPWIYSQVYLLGGNLGVLPLDLLSFTANTSGQDILLNWKTVREDNMQAYIVEHSVDGAKFDSIGDVTAKGSVNTSSYDFTHHHPGAGVHYYRLKEVDRDGQFTYSPIVSAKINGAGVELSIYPNPASDHIVITHKGINASYVRIMNAAGSVIGQYKLNSNANQTTISLQGFAKGNYFVEVVNSGFGPKQIAIQ